MGYNVHDVVRRVVFYYTRKHIIKKNQWENNYIKIMKTNI
jgi:hypothetical protein